jgi:hypothetical protein
MAEDGYTDDPSIGPDDPLWRRIPHRHLVADENRHCVRISSGAFYDDDDGQPMSVVLGAEVLAAGRPPESVLVGNEGMGLAAIPAKLARAKGQIIVRNPLDEEPAHALVVGNKTGSARGKFSTEARWVVRPPPESILKAQKLPAAWLLRADSPDQLLDPDPSRANL